VLQRSGYLERLSVDDSIEAETRRENLMELIGSIRAFEEAVPTATLTDFLEHIALSAQVDDYAAEEGTVTLMTVHSAKGLEFPVVFIVGLEQGVFPHSRSLDDAVRMEEERRLAYVAITRARERLFISHAERRWAYGQQQAHPPSQFIADIPRQLIEHHGQHDDDRQRVGAARRDTPRQRRQTSPRRRGADEVWVDHSYDQSQEAGAGAFRVGMKVRHKKFGVGEIRVITGAPPALNLTVYFKSVGPRTIRSDFVTAV